jgi:PleD family two-component response regulator
VLSTADSRDAEALYDRLQAALRERPLPKLGVVSFSGGVAELLSKDDATALIVRADAALALAKSSGRDMVVSAAKRASRDVA